jgi:hypothetical protein
VQRRDDGNPVSLHQLLADPQREVTMTPQQHLQPWP